MNGRGPLVRSLSISGGEGADTSTLTPQDDNLVGLRRTTQAKVKGPARSPYIGTEPPGQWAHVSEVF